MKHMMLGPRARVRGMFVGVELALVLSGCASTAVGQQEAAAVSETAPSVAASSVVAEGAPAPDFVALGHDGSNVALSSLRGRTVILYFYTRDETPLAIREALDFRDAWPDLREQGIVVVGVSTDTAAAHKAFAERLGLPFPLISDVNGSIARAYGVPVDFGLAERRTYVIGPDGSLEKIYQNVDVVTHVVTLLSDVQ
ncbi:MAG: peroxiredoxin [Labilithrix sp.]|nr:peroxiredoxin [Labilithrix sp.]MBX3211105.1 peroxiredoxin [Labilithrix sp.]